MPVVDAGRLHDAVGLIAATMRGLVVDWPAVAGSDVEQRVRALRHDRVADRLADRPATRPATSAGRSVVAVTAVADPEREHPEVSR